MDKIEKIYHEISNRGKGLPGSRIEDPKAEHLRTWAILTSKIMAPVDLMAIGINQFRKNVWGKEVSDKDKRALINYFIKTLQDLKKELKDG